MNTLFHHITNYYTCNIIIQTYKGKISEYLQILQARFVWKHIIWQRLYFILAQVSAMECERKVGTILLLPCFLNILHNLTNKNLYPRFVSYKKFKPISYQTEIIFEIDLYFKKWHNNASMVLSKICRKAVQITDYLN